MSEDDEERPVPQDPAGTQPKVDPESLVARQQNLLSAGTPADEAGPEEPQRDEARREQPHSAEDCVQPVTQRPEVAAQPLVQCRCGRVEEAGVKTGTIGVERRLRQLALEIADDPDPVRVARALIPRDTEIRGECDPGSSDEHGGGHDGRRPAKSHGEGRVGLHSAVAILSSNTERGGIRNR